MIIVLTGGTGEILRTIERVVDAADADRYLTFYPAAIAWREKTSQEIATEKETKADQDVILRKIFLVAFNHENRIRVLEGKAAITKAQFKTALAAL